MNERHYVAFCKFNLINLCVIACLEARFEGNRCEMFFGDDYYYYSSPDMKT